MVNFDNKKYDVFIAYHGDAVTGSEGEAYELYKRLQGMTLVAGGRPLNVYFHPQTDRYGRFERTPEIVAVTPMFVFAVNGNVPRDYNGMIPEYKENRMRRNIYEEICAFYDSPMRKLYGGKSAAKLYISDNTNFESGTTKLHPLFFGVADISVRYGNKIAAQNEVAEWIRYFYTNEYQTRIYEKLKALLESSKERFKAGEWLPEAESLWQLTFSEDIGRTLLIYYSFQIPERRADAVMKMREIAAKLRLRSNLSDKTIGLLNAIKQKYNI